jgi:hypothetical protein
MENEPISPEQAVEQMQSMVEAGVSTPISTGESQTVLTDATIQTSTGSPAAMLTPKITASSTMTRLDHPHETAGAMHTKKGDTEKEEQAARLRFARHVKFRGT